VIESNPKRLRHFHLFECNKKSVQALLDLKSAQPARPKREIEVHPGDSNKTIPKFLEKNPIKASEATFCLLDQRTFECDWATVVCLAQHKQGGYKIELFYFLAQAWLDRSFGGKKKNRERDLERWWGDDSWRILEKMPSASRGAFAAERFKKELGYRYAYAFPILEHGADGKNMFWMIHASDHPRAPQKMHDAYRSGGGSLCNDQQTDFIEPLQVGITLAPKRPKPRVRKKRRL
jgi:three-Cys-motif partner protein